MRPIVDISSELGIKDNFLIPYGKYKAKISLEALNTKREKGKLIIVTGMTPTSAGEGKTTTAVGLTQGLGKLGETAIATLREPSLGPIFGSKGGCTGGGKSLVEPQDEVNIHFTGDAHAVSSAHNLLAALTENISRLGTINGFNPNGITWRRVTDVQDRSLRKIITGGGGKANGPLRETGFDIVAASEIMAILALSMDQSDLRLKLARTVVGFTTDGNPVTVKDIGAVGSLMSLLRYALQPNLVQTTEGQPVIIHTGPFGNIAHGCSSVIADKVAMNYSDYVLTEAGFGADLGFEKFMHIKSRFSDISPSAAVIVASIRALKSHGGVSGDLLSQPDTQAVSRGLPNLEHLIGVIKLFGLPAIVALNIFPSDTPDELALVKARCEDAGAISTVESRAFAEGGEGTIELANAVINATSGSKLPNISYLYPENSSVKEKVEALATNVYNASSVNWSSRALRQIRTYENLGWGTLPVCMAKTHLSISHNRTMLGRPSNYTFDVSDVRASAGAGFLYPIAGNILTMPGLPRSPRSLDVNLSGEIIGL